MPKETQGGYNPPVSREFLFYGADVTRTQSGGSSPCVLFGASAPNYFSAKQTQGGRHATLYFYPANLIPLHSASHILSLQDFFECLQAFHSCFGGAKAYMRKILSEKERTEICNRYTDGEDRETLAREYGVKFETITAILNRHDIFIRDALPTKRFRADIIRKYLVGANLNELATEFHVTPTTISHLLTVNNVPRRSLSRVHTLRHYDITPFHELTSEALYWLGFLFADGTISKNRTGQWVVSISQSGKDAEHIRKLQCFLHSDHKIVRSPSKTIKGLKGRSYIASPYSTLSIVSNELGELLIGLGYARKIERRPADVLAKSRDFWRGFVDGDGHLREKNYQGFPAIEVCSAFNLLCALQIYVRRNIPDCKANICSVSNSDHAYRFGTSGKYAKELIEILYDRASIALDRKLLIAQRIIAL
jgi:hypothetical protein